MKNRYLTGLPHTDTDVHTFRAAIGGRVSDVAAGKFAAAAHIDGALEMVTRRSGSLLQTNALFAIVALLLSTRATAEMPALFMQFNRWAFIFALVSSVLLVTNLALVWARNPEQTYGNPDAAFEFHMGIYKGRAWRYSIALLLAFAAYALTLLSLTQMK